MSVKELRKNEMMAHLLDALDDGKDIGHYGRLVFTMVAQYFLDERELARYLQKDPSVDDAEVQALCAQVKSRGYSPPSRRQVLEWQKEQDFPICPNPEDPDAGNVYDDLRFPEEVYEKINEYYEQKARA
jgi:hypothetical protein